MPCSKAITISSGSSGHSSRLLGHRPDVRGGLVPGVLKDAALDGAAPEVVVDGVGLLVRGGHGHAVLPAPTPSRESRVVRSQTRTGAMISSVGVEGADARSRSAPGRCPCRCSRGPRTWRRTGGRCQRGAWRSAGEKGRRAAGRLSSYLPLAQMALDRIVSANSSRMSTASCRRWRRMSRAFCLIQDEVLRRSWPTLPQMAMTSRFFSSCSHLTTHGRVEAAGVREDYLLFLSHRWPPFHWLNEAS